MIEERHLHGPVPGPVSGVWHISHASERLPCASCLRARGKRESRQRRSTSRCDTAYDVAAVADLRDHTIDESPRRVPSPASFIPRVVSAGVPIRMPLVISGLLSSKGTRVLVHGDPGQVERFLCVLAGEFCCGDRAASGDCPCRRKRCCTRAPPAPRRAPGRCGSPASHRFRTTAGGFPEGDGLPCDHVHERAALDAGDDHRIEQLGHPLRPAGFRRDEAERVVEVLAQKDQTAAGAAERLVRCRGHDMAVGDRVVQQLLARSVPPDGRCRRRGRRRPCRRSSRNAL